MFDVYYVFFKNENKEYIARVVGDESMFEFCHVAYDKTFNILGLIKFISDCDDEWFREC